jgi:hypothetical protein
MDEAINKLRDDLNQKRGGFICFDVRESTIEHGTDDIVTLDSYVASLGLHGIGERWTQIQRSYAKEIMTNILHRALVYSYEWMPLNEAHSFPSQILGFFDRKKVRCYTNWRRYRYGYFKFYTSASVSPGLVDKGVVFVDDKRIGLLWVGDFD